MVLETEVDAGLVGDHKEPLYKIILRWVIWFFCVIALCMVMRFFFQEADVSGSSMHPTFQDGEKYMTLTKFTDDMLDYGTIVCFESDSTNGRYFIKRIVGMPGDTLVIHDGVLYVNDLETDYTFDDIQDGGMLQETFYTLSDDEYFVMGDNRNNSTDSRAFGPVTRDEISNLVLTWWKLPGWF